MHFLVLKPEAWCGRHTQTVASQLHSLKQPGLLGEKATPSADGEMHMIRLGREHSQLARKLSKMTSIRSERLRHQLGEAPTGQRWDNLSSNKNVLIHESRDTSTNPSVVTRGGYWEWSHYLQKWRVRIKHLLCLFSIKYILKWWNIWRGSVSLSRALQLTNEDWIIECHHAPTPNELKSSSWGQPLEALGAPWWKNMLEPPSSADPSPWP